MSKNNDRPSRYYQMGAIALTIALVSGSFLPAMAESSAKPSPVVATPKATNRGLKVSFNGKKIDLPWYRWRSGKIWRIGMADVPLMHHFGVELLDTSDRYTQPWRWFNHTSTTAVTRSVDPYRYVDVGQIAKIARWQLKISGDTLQIIAPTAQIQDIQVPASLPVVPPSLENQPLTPTPAVLTPQIQRFTIALDRPTPWKISSEKGAAILTIWGNPVPGVAAKFTPQIPILEPNTPNPIEDTVPSPLPPTNQALPQVKTGEGITEIRFNVPGGWQTQVTTATNPHRLVIDITPDAFKPRNIQWSKGVKWRQQYLNLGKDKFAATWLEINPKQVRIRPIWSNPTSMVGTASLGKTATLWKAIAAINAGFFNRNLLVPLGIIRRDRQWLSSPILNRGAIGWNDKGSFKIAKPVWQETLTTTRGDSVRIVQLNSGFIEPGISRYTVAWGNAYTPLSNNETILVVENNQITNQISSTLAGQNPIPIPSQGYLLTVRGTSTTIPSIGSQLRLNSQVNPPELNQYPQIIGAGPVLLQNQQIVLDGASEGFKEPFMKQTAIRSAIATTNSGQIIIIAVHNRAGGAGATLGELAQILQQMGVQDALNLDGGSSTSLYLGGQLIDRSPATAARVHNAIGIFALPNPANAR